MFHLKTLPFKLKVTNESKEETIAKRMLYVLHYHGFLKTHTYYINTVKDMNIDSKIKIYNIFNTLLKTYLKSLEYKGNELL